MPKKYNKDVILDDDIEENISNLEEVIETIDEVELNIKECKVTYWNKSTWIIGFDFNGTGVQMKCNKDMHNKRIVNVSCKDGNYEII